MSDPLIEILNELRTLNENMARIEDLLTIRRPTPMVPEPTVHVGALLATWHARAGSAPLTTREARELGLAGFPTGFPTGSLTAIARALGSWSGESWRVLGSSELYRLRRTQRHNQRVWSVERIGVNPLDTFQSAR